MRYSGHWSGPDFLDRDRLLKLLDAKIEELDVDQARQETERYVRDKSSLESWSKQFFQEIVRKIEVV